MDLIARDRKSYGCFALKIKHGKHLVELKRRLNKIVGYKGVEFITISRPTAYGEYIAPYLVLQTLTDRSVSSSFCLPPNTGLIALRFCLKLVTFLLDSL